MNDKIFLALLKTHGAHAELARQEFQKLDLSEGQPKIIYILNKSNGMVQKDLAEAANVKPPTMTALLDRMEKQGLIYKEETKVSGGKRAFHVFLSDKGKALADKVDDLVEELEERSFKGFSSEEKKLLLNMLGKVADNLK